MKAKLEGVTAETRLRCEVDNNILLEVDLDTVVLQECDHYRWYLSTDTIEESDKEDNDDEEDEEEDWEHFLARAHVAVVSVQNGKFYLVRMEKAVKEG
jgi:hypothetical protein